MEKAAKGASVSSYIRTQATVCALINLLLNPILAWLSHWERQAIPLFGLNSVGMDIAATTVVLCVLVSLFAANSVRQALLTGAVRLPAAPPRATPFLSLLPKDAWALGLLFGIGVASILTPLTLFLCLLLGVTNLPFPAFVLVKTLYTVVLGSVLTRWVILRQLLPPPSGRQPTSPMRSQRRPSRRP